MKDKLTKRHSHKIKILRYMSKGGAIDQSICVRFSLGYRLSERIREIDGRSSHNGLMFRGKRWMFNVISAELPNKGGLSSYCLPKAEQRRAKKFLKMLDKQSKKA